MAPSQQNSLKILFRECISKYQGISSVELSHVWLFETPWTGACQAPGTAWGTPPMAKVMRKEALAYAKGDRASGNPLFPSIYPQNQSLPTLLFYALTYTSDFTGGWPPLPLSEKELTYSSKSIKIPGSDKSVSTYELLWRLSSLPVGYLATCSHMWLFTASQRWEARDVLDLLKADSFGKLEIIGIVDWLGEGFFICCANNCC